MQIRPSGSAPVRLHFAQLPSRRRSRRAGHRRQRHAAQRRRPGVARIRHQLLHGPGHDHQAARAGDHRLDSARDGLRGVAHRAVGHPQRRHRARSASITRPKCRRSWPTWSTASSAARRPRYTFSLRVVTLDSPELADRGPAVAAARAGADAGHQRLAAGQGGRRDSAGRIAPPQRLPRTQLAVPDGQQRAVDGRFGDARPALRPRRDSAARHGRRLRSVAGPGRRRLRPWISARCCRPIGG